MLKTICLMILGVCCALVGVLTKNYLKKRRDLFNELVNIVDKIKNEIIFKKSFLTDIVRELDISEEISCVKDNAEAKVPFNKEEKQIIKGFFDSLGKSDLDGENYKLTNAKNRFSALAKKAGESYEKNGKLSVKLGCLFGLAIILIFI